jgi:zinc protease
VCAVVASAAACFEDWRKPGSAEEPVCPPLVPGRRTVRTAGMTGKSQTDICYGFNAIRRVDPRYYAYWIMNNILGQFGLGGRLADSIRERQGMAYYAYSTLDATVGEGPLIIRAGVDPANTARTIEAIDEEVRALAAAGPTPEEFEDTRDSLIGAIPRMLETNEGIAEFMQYVEHYGLGLDYDLALPGYLDAVTLDDVAAAAREVLDPERAAIGIAGPPE